MFKPFDGKKVLYHVDYWSSMEQGEIPAPVLVTIDPIHRCNLNCTWCNSNETIDRSGEQLTPRDVAALPPALAQWGVKAVCIAGGGEPLLHPTCSELIKGLVGQGIEVGVVTNGILLHRHIEALGLCRWVGVSVDAGRSVDYREQKGVDKFKDVVDNMRQVRSVWPGLELTYKYLIHPGNVHGLYKAAVTARSIGCNYFHARPAGIPWNAIPKNKQRSSLFTAGDVRIAVHMLNACAELETDVFKVVNTPDKFRQHDWGIKHDFSTCRATGMTCVIQANRTVGLCCDRRGDSSLTLCSWDTPEDFIAAWGSDKHKAIMRGVDLNRCPRCTYAPHNKLYEDFIKADTSCKWFI